MRKLTIIWFLSLILAPIMALAHHPAEDIVDADIYAMIDEMVSDTPHADLFIEEEDDMITTTVTTDFTSTVETLLQQGLVSAVSQLDGDVSMIMQFDTETLEDNPLLVSQAKEASGEETEKGNIWKDWGGKVIITIIQIKNE